MVTTARLELHGKLILNILILLLSDVTCCLNMLINTRFFACFLDERIYFLTHLYPLLLNRCYFIFLRRITDQCVHFCIRIRTY